MGADAKAGILFEQSINNEERKWRDEDIAMIKNGSWPCEFALPVKKFRDGDYECGCITLTERTVILKTSIWDFDLSAEKIKYNSVEELVADGWMVD